MLKDWPPFETSLPKLKSERGQRVRDLVSRLELDLLVVLSSGARGQRGNVRYVSNYATTSQSSCVLWAREGAPRLVVPYPVHRLWAEATSWIEDIQTDADYARAIARYLQELGLSRAKIGWVGPPFLLEGVHSGFDAWLSR
jgi:Creatinase/Prolidase N-terminal domain